MGDLDLKTEFLSDLNYLRLTFGLIIIILNAKLVKYVYEKYIYSNDNKALFSSNYLLFTISIFTIVSVIKSSIALSLGLVGALSIIRFRTAVKEPGQLITLLVLTAIALAAAAEKEMLTFVASIAYALNGIINSGKKIESDEKKFMRITMQEEMSHFDELQKIEGFSKISKESNGNVTVEFILESMDYIPDILKIFENHSIEYEIL